MQIFTEVQRPNNFREYNRDGKKEKRSEEEGRGDVADVTFFQKWLQYCCSSL